MNANLGIDNTCSFSQNASIFSKRVGDRGCSDLSVTGLQTLLQVDECDSQSLRKGCSIRYTTSISQALQYSGILNNITTSVC